MIRFYIYFILCFLISFSSKSQEWELVWSDEFNGSTLDNNFWTHEVGTGDWGWGNGELQYYQPQNTSVSNGYLTIQAKEEPQGISGQWGVPYYYSSSRIVTRDKFSFQYGKIEARIKTMDGEGFWPAFWLLPQEPCWPGNGEIDIMEQWGSDGPSNTTTGAAHVGNGCQGSSNYVSWNTTIDGSFADDFHTYSVVWYEDYIGWYLDDELQYSITPSSYPDTYNWPFNNNDWYIILNLAIDAGGPNSNTVFPSNLMVDYVRVFQSDDVQGCTNPDASNYNPDATFDDGSCLEAITFNVDMNCSSVSAQTVYITGPFNDWCCTCHPLSDSDGDGIWSGEYTFNNDGTLEYKYCFDNWTGQENLLDDVQNSNGSCVEVTDYVNYANRRISLFGSDVIINDVYGSCSECLSGCTDPSAINYNSSANYDDGSCDYDCSTPQVIFSVNTDGGLPTGYSNVVVNGSWNDWGSWGVVLSDEDQDNIWEGTKELNPGTYEFLYAYTGNADNWSGWGMVGTVPVGSSCDYNPYDSYANYGVELECGDIIELPTVCFSQCTNCETPVSGCTDSQAANYNPLATLDDGSCYSPSACDLAPSGLFVDNIIHNRISFNWSLPLDPPSHYMIKYRQVGASTWTVMTAGTVNSIPFYGTSRTRYFMQPSTTYEWSIRSRVLDEDGSINCQSPWSPIQTYTTLAACPNLINHSTTTEANWVNFNAELPNSSVQIINSKGKLKRTDENSFRYVTGSADGIDFRKGNFTESTSYLWHTKTWCFGNADENENSDPQYHSGWGDFMAFSTEDLCDKLPFNLTSSTNANNTAITMSWDVPSSGQPHHYFLELNNLSTGQQFLWNNIPGSATSKTKYNQVSGHAFSWRIRGACGSIGTSWATPFTSLAYYTLGAARFNVISDLMIYPNPSNNVFNLSFSSLKVKSITIRVVNAIGSEIYKVNLHAADGVFKHQLDMIDYSKGVYFIELISEKGTVNSKIFLQ